MSDIVLNIDQFYIKRRVGRILPGGGDHCLDIAIHWREPGNLGVLQHAIAQM